METAELEILVEELELRVERLRSLYEQYFMGIEKIEPAVLRKDVERRFWTLRREHIRNTGLRFKFQQVIQRYNTFSQYWGRIIREIEAGTYKRDVRRVAVKFGAEALTFATRRRFGKMIERARAMAEPAQKPAGAGASAAPSTAASLEKQDHSVPPPSATEYDIDVSFDEEARLSAPPRAGTSQPAKRKSSAAPAPIHDLDFDEELGDDGAGHAHRHVRSSSKPSAGRLEKLTAQTPNDDESSRVTLPRPPPLKTMQPVKLSAPPRRAGGPSQTTGHAATQPPPRKSAHPSVHAESASHKPVHPGSHTASAPPKPSETMLSEQRAREIYERYVQAKRECKESTTGITEAGLVDMLRSSAMKLREKHKGRSVDFEVVVKDGKAVLKPVIKVPHRGGGT